MSISGLIYQRDFISESTEDALLSSVDGSDWLEDLKRRVQHYGYKYDYRNRAIDYSMFLGDLPGWSQEVTEKLVASEIFPETPDQLIVNEYEPSQGIAKHIDCVPCFKDTIGSITLNSGCYLDFKSVKTGEVVSVYLYPRSLIVFCGEARYEWMHSIAKRTYDDVDGQRIMRSRRVSLTFRNVVLSE